MGKGYMDGIIGFGQGWFSVDMGKVWRCWNYPKVLWAEMGKGGESLYLSLETGAPLLSNNSDFEEIDKITLLKTKDVINLVDFLKIL